MPERNRSSSGRYDYESNRGKFNMTVDFHLPHGLNEQLQLHPRRISAMCQVGLIEQLTIKTRHGATSQYYPNMLGMSTDGLALGGKAGLHDKVPIFKMVSDEADGFPQDPIAYRRTSNTIAINSSEVEQRIRHADEDITDPSQWRGPIDHAIRWGILAAAIQNVYRIGAPEDVAGVMGQVAVVGLASSIQDLKTLLVGIPLTGLTYGAMAAGSEQIRNREHGRKINLSLTGSPAADRLAVLTALQTLPVVRVKK